AQHAGNVCAHLHVILAHRPGMQQGVVADNVAHFQFSQFCLLRDMSDCFITQITNLVLCIEEHWNEERPLGRILLHFLVEELVEFFGNYRHRYLSISPSTISMLPIAATTSAIRRPSHILGSAWRFA